MKVRISCTLVVVALLLGNVSSAQVNAASPQDGVSVAGSALRSSPTTLVQSTEVVAHETPPVQTVARFDRAANETPENIVRLGDRTVVSLAFASTVVVLDRSGAEVQRVVIDTRGGFIAGLADDKRRRGIAVAVSSPDATVAGIWVLPRSRGDLGRPFRLSALPVTAFPNGLSFDRSGILFVADSRLGVIWRIPQGRTPDAQVYASSDLLLPAAGDPLPGANGLKVFRGQLWISNTSRSTLLALALGGRPALGRVPVIRLAGTKIDDFAFDTDGFLYAALNEGNALVRVTTDGSVTTLADAADGLHNTSAVALERGRKTLTIYFTNAAFDGPTPVPSVQKIDIRLDRHRRSPAPGANIVSDESRKEGPT